MQQQTIQSLPSQQKVWLPKYHFYKSGHWINDPNGLFYLDKTYHLFFQLNPGDTVWGNMHWGHATSTDLINWQHKPTALFAEPEGLGYIFSGGAIVDHHNSSGFALGNEIPVIATYTQQSETEEQVQSIAYSIDGGNNLTVYNNNPVIPNPGLKDFRDPKVVWYERDQVWIKSVVAGQSVFFYRSRDLKVWDKISEFGEGYGSHDGVWECPDLFPLLCKKSGRELWVLLVSINPGGPNGGSATQYFIGDFDGINFKPIDKQTRWLDYGTDCYAGITWDNTPNIKQQRTYIAWMSNWLYANVTPDNSWRGAMTLPRDISLVKDAISYSLQTKPVVQVDTMFEHNIIYPKTAKCINVSEAYKLQFTVKHYLDSTTLIWKNKLNETFKLTIDLENNVIIADRTNAGFTEKGFPSIIEMPLDCRESNEYGDKFNFDIYMDACSFELFVNDGTASLTILLFPNLQFDDLQIDKEVDDINIMNFKEN